MELGALRQRVDGLKKLCLAVWAVHALDVNFDRVVAAVALRVAVIVRHFFRGATRLDCPRAQQRYVKGCDHKFGDPAISARETSLAFRTFLL